MTTSNGAEVTKSSSVKTLIIEDRFFKQRTFKVLDYRYTDKYIYMTKEDGRLASVPLAEVNDWWEQ